MIARFIFLLAGLTLGTVHATEQLSAGEAFGELKTLVGDWEGTTESGRYLKVTFRLTAADSVLIETWTLSPQRESLTLYHMDRNDLVATHYCPLGNQPRLRLKAPTEAALFRFEFVGASNLTKPEAAHQHAFEIEPLQRNSFARSETYVEEGTAETERIVYRRVRKEEPPPPPVVASPEPTASTPP